MALTIDTVAAELSERGSFNDNSSTFSYGFLLNIVKSLIFAGILFRVFVILCLCNSLKFVFLEGL
jgi:hypothetical protein